MHFPQIFLQLVSPERFRILHVGMARASFSRAMFQTNLEVDCLVVAHQVRVPSLQEVGALRPQAD